MGIVCVEDYLLGHFSVGNGWDGRNRGYLKSMLVLGLAGARIAMALRAVVSLLLQGSLTLRDLLHLHQFLPEARS